MLDQCGEGNDDVIALDTVIDDLGIAPALEPDRVDVHDDITAVADDLSFSLVIARLSADIAGVKSDSVGGGAGFFDDDHTYGDIVVRRIGKPVQMTVRNLIKGDIEAVITLFAFFYRGEFHRPVCIGFDCRDGKGSNEHSRQKG